MLLNKDKLLLVIFLIPFILIVKSCTNEENIQTSTVPKTIDEIVNDWRYYGFKIFYNAYYPSENYLDSMNKYFNPTIHKFILFTSPSCFSCGQMDSLLPQTAKIISLSEIPDSSYVLFDTPNINSSHPYDGIIFLKDLPSVYLLNSGTNDIYSVLDTYEIRKANSINTSLEQIMYEFLK